MTFTKLKAASLAAAVAALAFMTTPANAAGSLDDHWPRGVHNEGVDFDAACLVTNPLAPVGEANNVESSGANTSCLIGTYDGSTDTTDFGDGHTSAGTSNNLTSNGVNTTGPSDNQLVATFVVDGPIPAPGSMTPPTLGAADLPDNKFVGFGYKALYQNPDTQNNTPYLAGGRMFPLPAITGINEHYLDGFHLFIGFDAVWDGDNWTYSAQVGTLDPGPDGAFFFDELGTSSSVDALGNPVWADDDPCSLYGTNWSVSVNTSATGPSSVTVTADGVIMFSNIQDTDLCTESWYAFDGDPIINIKYLSTADATVTLPVTIPLSLIPGFGDLTSVGGFVFFSDMTDGNSVNTGTGATLATLGGDLASTPCVNDGILGIRPCVSFTTGLLGLGLPDTLGDGPRCWTPTLAGLIIVPNPLWVAGQPCYIDDDSAPGPNGNIPIGERGTLLSEWWDTNYDFTM